MNPRVAAAAVAVIGVPGLLFGLSVLAVIAAAGAIAPSAPGGIPPRVLDAYVAAATHMQTTDPDCHLRWTVLAGIGEVESRHAAGHQVDDAGDVTPPVIGEALDGTPGRARVDDTDRGIYDGDAVTDRAVGPMQLLPSTWRDVGRDGNGDHRVDPQNVDDAALGAAVYVCAAGDLADDRTLRVALSRYNHSSAYVAGVLAAIETYDNAAPTGDSADAAEAAVAAALTKVGRPYVWGATGPASFDCSGLTQWSYSQAGLRLPRTSREQWAVGVHPPFAAIAPGDLIFYAEDLADPTTIYHVAMYVGGGDMIEAPHAGATVRVRPVRSRHLFGVVRPTVH